VISSIKSWALLILLQGFSVLFEHALKSDFRWAGILLLNCSFNEWESWADCPTHLRLQLF